LPKSSFLEYLIRKNSLGRWGFFRFVFFDGMLFASKEKWWGKKGLRGSSHEGLDLCFFEDHHGNGFRLDESVAVPMLYDGNVEAITNDFLGKTVITRHLIDSGISVGSGPAAAGQVPILSLYGHLNPDRELRIGDVVKQGEVFATIGAIDNRKKKLLPHLHISLARPEMLPLAPRIEWEMLNKADRSVFIDPFAAIQPAYRVMTYDDTLNVSQEFVPCSRVTDAGI
jgi:hypothetical protein